MSALSLTPFIAPAAGTIAFLLLLCVSIGAVLSLTPFRANGNFVTDGIDGETGAESVFFVAMPGALAADDETAASRASASQATVTRLDTFLPETDLTDREALDVSLESHPEVSGNAVRVFEQIPYSTPVDRWWGINE